ncbi:methyltransferase domain-containing protein [Clostridium tyrobutyricum]|uniref:methyltransferase domain-containing protein n=1 Tax=Clostridium tyrobutyricum TaxID=1519 RepID=UPI00068D8D49|nr:methyltransferase domain-containing protein [Clostridium tyrobutyricum]MBV4445942.1 methyltransferase domain-containing protein [Clostridium tyrobutyricum]
MENDIDLIKKQLKDNIQQLVDAGDLKEAKKLIEQYKNITKDDEEAYSMDAVILIMEGKLEKAEQVLREGLSIDEDNFDLNYNLGYAYEKAEKFNLALECYEKARSSCNDKKLKEQINSTISGIKDKHPEAINQNRLKLVFFVKQGMDSFLGDIIDGLSDEYITKKVIVNDYKQIDKGMHWADICWFEWCDELVMYGSKLLLASEKKIICRIHGYEVYTDFTKKTNWKNIDDLIIVAPHIRRIFEESTKNIDKGNLRIHTIFCGINLNKYPLNIKKKGYNLGYLGYINFKKNMPLTLDIFKKLHDIDSRYKLYIAGQFQDARTLSYFEYFINEYKLYKNIIFDGWQNEKQKIAWLKKIDYIIISSIDEGLCFAAAESMVSGIKPILHNCEGLKDHYDKRYIFNSLDEAVDMIMSEDYDSKNYRKFIESNYSLNEEIKKIEQVIESRKTDNKEQSFNYKEYWNNRLDSKFDIEGVGYIGLGKEYNEYLYKARFYSLGKVIKKLFKNLKSISVFEIGPGIGLFTNYFKKMGVNDYYAIDISKKSVEILSSKYKNFNFMQGDISDSKNYPRNNKYDLVFGADVLLHLTDENKFKITLKNMNNVLSNNGYMVIYDAISKDKIESTSPHVKIRSIEYIRNLLDKNDMEIVTSIPIYFFNSNPFDISRVQTESSKVIDIFNSIQRYFNENHYNIREDKKIILEYLYYIDKLCLANYQYGLSEKLIIIKKKQNKTNIDINIGDLWNEYDIKNNIDLTLQKIEKNKRLYNDKQLIYIQQKINNLIFSNYDIKEVYEKINLFNNYEIEFVDKYNFDNSKIVMGKKEKLNDKYELIEFILAYDEAQLIITGIIYDNEKKEIILPDYLNFSRNKNKFIKMVKNVIYSNIEYNNRDIAGFINDKKIIDDIKENQLAYNWERGIPATQFMPLMGYINVIERYKLASNSIKKSDIVLEAACGFGYGAAYISKNCRYVEALDLAEENIVFGKKAYNFNNISWIVGDVTKLPYRNNYFDVYVSFETLEHLPLNLIEKYFSEAIRVLKNKGKMIISTPNKAVRENVKNPFHIKEYNFLEFNELLYKYFSNVQYYSIVNNRLTKEMNLAAYNMMAICEK